MANLAHFQDREAAIAAFDRLWEADTPWIVRWSALLRWFNADSLQQILDIQLSADDFANLTQFSLFVHPRLAPEYWACHDLVLGAQGEYLRRAHPDRCREIHSQAARYYQKSGHDLEALYHAFFFDGEAAYQAWQEQEDRAAFQFDQPLWARLMEIGLAVEHRLPEAERAYISFRAGRRDYYWPG